MKVLPSQTGVVAAARTSEPRADRTAFTAALDKASTEVELRKGEKLEPVSGHAYAEISGGRRSGMYVNTSGNSRHGEAFVLVHKRGVEYHIYGSGKDRLVVALKQPAAQPETLEPVEGRPYSEITSGPRSGMYINTSGGKRDGEVFTLVQKNGVDYHIYGSGKDREVVALKRDDES
jgi:hypothetical protein